MISKNIFKYILVVLVTKLCCADQIAPSHPMQQQFSPPLPFPQSFQHELARRSQQPQFASYQVPQHLPNPHQRVMLPLNGNSAPHSPPKLGLESLLEAALNKPPKTTGPDTMNELFASTFKKYDVKRYLLRKILGPGHENDEADGGFFSNQHLKRHGTAGVAGKLLGELIGIKIRESVDRLGKRFGEIAKDFTARNIVNAGNSFARMLKLARTRR